MNFDFTLFLTALGLAFVLEGLPYFIWAERMPSFLAMLSQRQPSTLRKIGLTALLLGLVLIFLARY
jgi:hypothetical protein